MSGHDSHTSIFAQSVFPSYNVEWSYDDYGLMPYENKLVQPDRYKTRMCDKFLYSGKCPYGNRCMFAHGQIELRTPEKRKMCKGTVRHSPYQPILDSEGVLFSNPWKTQRCDDVKR